MPETALEQKLKQNYQTRQDFIKLLLACPSIKDRTSRDNLLTGVCQGDLVIKIARDNVAHTDVENILNFLLNYSGALEELISCIGDWEGKDSIPFGELQAFCAALTSQERFTVAQIAELKSLIQGAGLDEKLWRLKYKETGRSLVNTLPEAANLDEMLANLADTQYSLFEFTLHLALSLPQGDATRRALESWVEKVACTLPEEEKPEIAAIRKKLIAAQQVKVKANPVPYLLLKVEEVLNAKGKRELRLTGAWLQPVGGKLGALDEAQQVFTPKGFSQFFDRLLETRIAGATENTENLQVEIFVPHELLNQPRLAFEWLEIDNGARSLGVVYNIVYRYGNRKKIYYSPWSRKSELLNNEAKWPENIIWYCGSACKDWPGNIKIYPNDNYVFLGGSLPLQVNKAHEKVVGYLDLNALPVFLWFRQPPADPAEVSHYLEQEIRQRGLLELPNLVKELRRQVADETRLDYYGRHIVLLWDDYARQISSGPLANSL
jgi:hypothetical protein